MGFFEVRFWIKEFPGNGVISLLWQLRCQCNLIITNLHLYLIQLWWQLFQIFDNGDVVNTQTWEELTLKTPSSHHKHFFFSHTLSPTLPGLPGIPSSPERPCKKNTTFADIKFVVLLYSAYKERVLKYKGRENRARENFSLFTGGILVYEQSVLWQTAPASTAKIVSPSPRFCVSVALLSSWLSTIKSLVKYFLTFSPLFPRDPREPRWPSVPWTKEYR